MKLKLFISYSRDDKAWVFELWRALRDRAHHDAWLDQRVAPAQDWWDTILTNLEESDCVIYILTPKSAESIYCRAELAHALALNKPVVPLILKPCDYPSNLKARRIQYYQIADNDTLGDILFTTERGLGEIRLGLFQGKYPAPNSIPARPAEPKPAQQPEQVLEVLKLAETAAQEGNFSLAEVKYQQVVDTDPQGWGQAAAKRLATIRRDRERTQKYDEIAQMAENSALVELAWEMWQVFVQNYGNSHQPPPGLIRMPTRKPRSKIYDILPAPFDWCEIPAGKVTLEAGGYVPEGGQTFDVPAFTIAKYPVTNAQFAKFLQAGGYDNQQWWTKEGWQARQSNKWTEPRLWQDSPFNSEEHPVVGVSWFEALAFCNWLREQSGESIILPTEQQWQRAAQGNDGWVYPWDNDWDASRCQNSVGANSSNSTAPVTQFEGRGDSPFGVVDMSGNVWEWTVTDFDTGSNDGDKPANKRVLRGGSWNYSGTVYFRVVDRGGSFPDYGFNYWGFRLASS
jgi:formylglycine-generating enzyme required for sulfatase activity